MYVISADTNSLKVGQSPVVSKPTKLLSNQIYPCPINVSCSGNSPAVRILQSVGKSKLNPSSIKKDVQEDMEEEEEEYSLWSDKSNNRFIETVT